MYMRRPLFFFFFLVSTLQCSKALLQPIRTTTPATKATTGTTTSILTPIAQVHRMYANFSEGKHWNERVSIDVVVQEVKQVSPRLVFLRVRDRIAATAATSVSSWEDPNHILELLLRERDGFLTCHDIEQVMQQVAMLNSTTNTILHCRGFPEKLSTFDGPTFFPHLASTITTTTDDAGCCCLHVVAINVTTAQGQFIPIRPIEEKKTTTTTTSHTIPTSRFTMAPMPQLQQKQQQRTNISRGGTRNRDRGGIFATWVLDTFGSIISNKLSPTTTTTTTTTILDVAGGAGQLAFQFGVRRGYNITVVDPRPQLRLSPDQQRTLQYHRDIGLRAVTTAVPALPSQQRDLLPPSDYGYHFYEIPSDEDSTTTTNNNNNNDNNNNNTTTSIMTSTDRTWLIGSGATATRVRHLSSWFDQNFVVDQSDIWQKSSVILGMHPDQATEDIVDLALAHGKPFAVVPCCVFWKQNQHRKNNNGGKTTVRTWEQFCEYLAAKDTQRIQVTTLPMPGRNVVLYSLGNHSKVSSTVHYKKAA